jgi:hypothetical protein
MSEPRRSVVGKIGLALSLLPCVGHVSMLIFHLGQGSPFETLEWSLILVGPPVALIVSLVGYYTDTDKKPALVGTYISAYSFLILYWIFIILLFSLPR